MTTHIAVLTPANDNTRSLSPKPIIDTVRADEIQILSKGYDVKILATFDNHQEAMKNIRSIERQYKYPS